MTKSGRGAPRAPVQGDSHPAGGVGPACRSIRGRIRASTGPLGGLGPAAMSVRSVLHTAGECAALWLRREDQSNQGPKRQPGTAANLVAGQAAGPLGKPGASQNCPQLYQGESGGLEPAMKPMAGQAGAPLRFLSPLRGPGGLPGQSLATFF